MLAFGLCIWKNVGMCVRVNETCHQQASRAPQNTWQKSSQLSAARLSLQPVSSKEAHRRQEKSVNTSFYGLRTPFNRFSAFDGRFAISPRHLPGVWVGRNKCFGRFTCRQAWTRLMSRGINREECAQLAKCKQVHVHPLEIACGEAQIRGVY